LLFGVKKISCSIFFFGIFLLFFNVSSLTILVLFSFMGLLLGFIISLDKTLFFTILTGLGFGFGFKIPCVSLSSSVILSKRGFFQGIIFFTSACISL